MVCDRCKMAVRQTLEEMHLEPQTVELGVATVAVEPDAQQLDELANRLHDLGFELLESRQQRMVERMKAIVLRVVREENARLQTNLSDLMASEMRVDYSRLSKLFSEVTGKTLERYFIEQRVERVKELITYEELSLKEISLQLNYSSVAYLSSQFKQVTGMTPTEFRGLHQRSRKSLDEI